MIFDGVDVESEQILEEAIIFSEYEAIEKDDLDNI